MLRLPGAATSIKISSPRVSACGSITSTASCRHIAALVLLRWLPPPERLNASLLTASILLPAPEGVSELIDLVITSYTLCLSSPSALLHLKSLLNSIAAALSKPCGIIERAWLISHN